MKIKLSHIRVNHFTLLIIFLLLISVAVYSLIYFLKAPIKVGILHSLTGNMALSEKPVVDAELMAIAEINANGGLLKRKIIPIVVDGKSDDAVFAYEAERLIKHEKVAVIFGCWTSASRKSVRQIIEKYNNLLVYPIPYEGMESSSHILYTGATQNQQIVPAALWSIANLGKRFFLVGSESIFSRMANEILKSALLFSSAEIVGQEFLFVNTNQVKKLIENIIKAKPDVILNTIHGETNLSFFKELRARGITPEKIPVMTISSMSETEFAHIHDDAMAGDYVTANYFQSIDREENNSFVANFKKTFGADRVVSETEEGAYNGVYIWADAVIEANSWHACHVRNHLHNRVRNAPSGVIYTDNTILNTWKMAYIGKLRHDGQFTILWDSKKSIEPLLYPIFKTEKEWKEIETHYYELWGKRWTKITDSINK